MPFLRHPSVMPPFSAPRHFAATLISDLCPNNSEPSCLLIRRRLSASAAGSRLALHGQFDASVRPRLLSALAALPADDKPLAVDLTHAISLDRETLQLLIGASGVRSPVRAIVFRVAATGAVRRMIARLGWEEKMGLTATALPETFPKVPTLALSAVTYLRARPALTDLSEGGQFNG